MLNIGMVGVGDISGIYLKNITETFKEIKLVAVCDLIKERALNAQKNTALKRFMTRCMSFLPMNRST